MRQRERFPWEKKRERFFVSGNFVDFHISPFKFKRLSQKVKKFQISTTREEIERDYARYTFHFFSFFFHTHTHIHTHLARVELNRRTPRARLRSERSLVSEREREIFLLEFFQCQTTTISLLLQSFSLR